MSIDTDAHSPGQMEWQNYGCDKAAAHGIDPDQIVNTWPADTLLAWCASTAPSDPPEKEPAAPKAGEAAEAEGRRSGQAADAARQGRQTTLSFVRFQ